MFYKDLLFRFTEMSQDLFDTNLVGIYLHGSAAMGCFNPKKSDLDLILVVKDDISATDKMTFMQQVIQFNQEAPAKGLELSIVKKDACCPFVYPTPYELHFSNTHLNWFRENPQDYIANMKGTDKDLAAHFTIIQTYGIVLYGDSIKETFAPVPKADYIDSIWFDIENACEDILESPMYMTLNLCRVLAYLQDNQILSKKAGGEWGLQNLPANYQPLIKDALQCYKSDVEMVPDPDIATVFANEMLTTIQNSRRIL